MLDFWTAFHDFLATRETRIKLQRPQPQNWMHIAIGRSEFTLIGGLATAQKKLIRVALICKGSSAKAHFQLLLKDRADIERECGFTLDWRELPHRIESWITLENQAEDPSNRSAWPRQHAWILEKLERLDRVFRERVRRLDADTYQDAEFDDDDAD